MATVLVLGTLGYLVGFSPVLAVRELRVEGLSTELGRQVREQAQVPVGEPLARVDIGAVQARVSGIGRLETVEVTRSWPSTVLISATPRVPVVAVRNPEGQLEVADASGELYDTVGRVPAGVPLLSAAGGPPTEHQLRQVADTLQALPESTTAALADLQVRGRESVTFTLGATQVIWGAGEQSALKARVLQTLLEREHGVEEADPGTVIDLSAPGTPVVTTADEG